MSRTNSFVILLAILLGAAVAVCSKQSGEPSISKSEASATTKSPATPSAMDAGPAPTQAPPTRLATLDAIEGFTHLQFVVRDQDLQSMLRTNQFAVDGNRAYREMFEIYERNRYPLVISSRDKPGEPDIIQRTLLKALPSVVTPDVVVHNLHLFFDFALASAEERRFAPELDSVLVGLLDATREQARVLAGSDLIEAVRDVRVFLATGLALLRTLPATSWEADDPYAPSADQAAGQEGGGVEVGAQVEEALKGIELPPEVRTGVREEFQRVLAAEGAMPPTVFAYPGELKEDYSQYVVRGHYLKTPKLQAYFRAMMWLGRIGCFFASDRGTKSALLLGFAARNKPTALERWQRIFEVITFLVGNPDDITFIELLPILDRVLGQQPQLEDLKVPAKLQALRQALAKLRPPRIQGLVTRTEHGPALGEMLGFRLFSQRSVLDAVIFQALVDPQVPNRTMIKVLELPDILGSLLAKELLAPAKLEAIPGYAQQREKLVREVPAELERDRNKNVCAGWLWALSPLLAAVAPGAPAFMLSAGYPAWRLSVYLASYAELKHDTVLYSKQAVAEMGGPGFEDTEVSIDDRGYVVPEVELYKRVHQVLAALREGLLARQLLPDGLQAPFGKLQSLVKGLQTISEKELANQPLTSTEYDLIRFLGGDLEHFWEVSLIGAPDGDRNGQLNDNNAQLIADIFTSSLEGILHVATGYVHPVWVIFPLEGKLHLGRGAVLSYYELIQDGRLNDREWRRLLSDKHPPRPSWTSRFIVESGKDWVFDLE